MFRGPDEEPHVLQEEAFGFCFEIVLHIKPHLCDMFRGDNVVLFSVFRYLDFSVHFIVQYLLFISAV